MAKRKLYQQLAFVWFLVAGTLIFLLGAAILGVGIALTNSDEFNEPIELKAQVRPRMDYVQYWVGLPYIFTGIALILLAFLRRNRIANIFAMVFCLISVVLSLAGLVVDGPDFAWWNSERERERFWERQSGYSCSSKNGQCVCETSDLLTTVSINDYADCGTVENIASLFGVLVGLMIAGLILLLITIFIMVYILTTNREKAYWGSGNYTTNMGATELYAVNNDQQNVQYHQSSLPSAYDTNGTNQGYQGDYTVLQGNNSRGYKKEYQYDDDGLPVMNGTQLPQQQQQQQQGFEELNTDTNRNRQMVLDPGHFKLGDDDIY